MIRLNGTKLTNIRKPWRRRISNQIAVIAAIMLFASTQIGAPQAAGEGFNTETEVAAQFTNSAANSGSLESSVVLSPASSDSSKNVSTKSKKRKRLKLDLFLFRR